MLRRKARMNPQRMEKKRNSPSFCFDKRVESNLWLNSFFYLNVILCFHFTLACVILIYGA